MIVWLLVMLASCSSECKDLSGESFCVHYKKLCTTNVNVKQACRKTCGLCKCYFQLVSTQFFGLERWKEILGRPFKGKPACAYYTTIFLAFPPRCDPNGLWCRHSRWRSGGTLHGGITAETQEGNKSVCFWERCSSWWKNLRLCISSSTRWSSR